MSHLNVRQKCVMDNLEEPALAPHPGAKSHPGAESHPRPESHPGAESQTRLESQALLAVAKAKNEPTTMQQPAAF